MSLKSKTISGAKWTTVSRVTLAVVGIVKISVLARFLDAADFGLMALVTFVLGFMNLFMDMGLTSAILHKQDISDTEYASLYWINVLFSFILFAIICLVSSSIAEFYEEPELSILIPLMGISVIFSAAGRQFKTVEEKVLNFKYIAVTDIIGSLFSLAVGVILAVKGFGVFSLVYAALTQYFITNNIYFINGLRDQGMLFHFKYTETKPFLKIGIYQVAGQIVNYFNRDLDILLIGKFFGSEILGGYSLAKQLVKKPMAILNPVITRVSGPVLALSQDDKSKLKERFLIFLNVVSTTNFTAYGLLAILAYPAVLILYGQDFTHIVILVQILSLYMYLRSVGNPVGGLIIATGRTDMGFYWNLLVLIVTPVAIVIGSQFSVEAVAWALVTSMVILYIPVWKFMVNKLCGATLIEFMHSYIPRWSRLYNIVLEKKKND